MGYRAKKARERPCRSCGAPFVPAHFLGHYCSPECKRAGVLKNKRATYAARKALPKSTSPSRYYPRLCDLCSDVFQPTSARSMYCHACRQGKKHSWNGDVVTTLLRSSRRRGGGQCLLTRAWFEEQWEKQGGLCAISGVRMTRDRGRGYGNVLGEDGRKVSIDQVRHKAGYAPGNCRLVCVATNVMRNSMSDEALLKWCRAIIQYAERPVLEGV